MKYVLVGIIAIIGLIVIQTYRNDCYLREPEDFDGWSACILRK